MPASAPAESGKMYPNRIEEDQEVEMTPVVMGTPPFSSPEPETDGQRMLPLEDQTTAEVPEGVELPEGTPTADLASAETAGDFKALIAAATTEEELDAIQAAYDDSGKDFTTVEDALDAKRAALEESEEA